jgi:thiol-disulfide isomerase/thioredoxin
MKQKPFRRIGSAILLLIGLIVAVGIAVIAGGSDEPDRRASLTVYPTPAPVTFIPPTPLPPTITPTDPVVAHPVPDVTLTTLDGGALRLRDLEGQIVFLNFWATWCEPCREEMPELQAFQDSHRADGVRVIAVTDPTEGQTEADIRAFVDDFDLSLTVALSSDADFYRQFAVAQIPTTFIIDPAGMVRVRHMGALDAHDMAAYVQFVAAYRDTPQPGTASSLPTSQAGN